MPTDKLEVENVFIVDLETGQRTELKGIDEVLIITKEDLDKNEPYMSLTEPKEFTATMEVKEIGMRMLNMIRGRKIFKGNMNDIVLKLINFIYVHRVAFGYCNIYDICIKQNRTHKKKRINKKWAKRYGYTCMVYYVEGDLR